VNGVPCLLNPRGSRGMPRRQRLLLESAINAQMAH